MRLTKGKIKKLLKKKNQTKKKKHPLKRTHLNKSLKPKRKVFDVSKKTFKNRQTYGGTNLTTFKRSNDTVSSPTLNPIVNFAAPQQSTRKREIPSSDNLNNNVNKDGLFESAPAPAPVSKSTNLSNSSSFFSNTQEAPTKNHSSQVNNPMRNGDTFHNQADNQVFQINNDNVNQNINIEPNVVQNKEKLQGVSSHPSISLQTQKQQKKFENNEVQEQHNKIHKNKLENSKTENSIKSSTNQVNQPSNPTFTQVVSNTFKNGSSNFFQSTPRNNSNSVPDLEDAETKNPLLNPDNLKEKKIEDEKTKNIELAQLAVKEAANLEITAKQAAKKAAELATVAKNAADQAAIHAQRAAQLEPSAQIGGGKYSVVVNDTTNYKKDADGAFNAYKEANTAANKSLINYNSIDANIKGQDKFFHDFHQKYKNTTDNVIQKLYKEVNDLLNLAKHSLADAEVSAEQAKISAENAKDSAIKAFLSYANILTLNVEKYKNYADTQSQEGKLQLDVATTNCNHASNASTQEERIDHFHIADTAVIKAREAAELANHANIDASNDGLLVQSIFNQLKLFSDIQGDNFSSSIMLTNALRYKSEADNYYESALNYSKQAADLVSNAKNLLLNHPPPAPPTPAQPAPPTPAQPAPTLQQLNFKIEAIEYKKFLKNIDDKQYNTELTQNIELHIKFYIDKMKKENYFYDTNVGEYKVSYLYNESNNMKNIYFVMFYYKNNFGSVKDILQCLFIYNTIILNVNDMPSWITQISQNTLAKEFPSGGSPGILFYENSSKFIKDNSITLTEINAFNQIQLQQENKHMTGFIHDTRKTNYNYILYISNNIYYNNLMTQIIDPIIQPIIDSKISK